MNKKNVIIMAVFLIIFSGFAIYAQGTDGAVEGTNLFETVKKGKSIMIILLVLGLASLTIIIERIIFFTRNKIWSSIMPEKYLLQKIESSKSKYREDLEDELKSEYQNFSNRMERGLALLSGIGNISPIIGFLGTVVGMINAFASIATATTVNAKVVAVGIEKALVTTAGGLSVAAPSLIAFYFFMHVIQIKNARAEDMILEKIKNAPLLSQSIDG